MATVDDVREVLAGLPRSSEVLVRDRVKFRVGQIVYVAFSQDETEIGFAFPKDERAALVAARPGVFFLPRESELRFHWVEAWLDALDAGEMRELVLDAGGWSCRSGSPARCLVRQPRAVSRAEPGSHRARGSADWPDSQSPCSVLCCPRPVRDGLAGCRLPSQHS